MTVFGRFTAAAAVTVFFGCIGVLYGLALSPPLHFFYESLPPVGKSSVYVPGAGFSGFWYHLGLFHRVSDLRDYNYYCYSSGCLSLLLAVLNTTVDETFEACSGIQESWKTGNLSRYEIVDHFLDRLVPEDSAERLDGFLHRFHVLVTTAGKGVEARRPANYEELIELMIKTTWIPFFTRNGILADDDDERYLDGGFSRVLHPKCQYTVRVPNTLRSYIHSLNPAFGRDIVDEFWEMGRTARHPFVSPAS